MDAPSFLPFFSLKTLYIPYPTSQTTYAWTYMTASSLCTDQVVTRIFLEQHIEAFISLSSVILLSVDSLVFISFKQTSKFKHILDCRCFPLCCWMCNVVAHWCVRVDRPTSETYPIPISQTFMYIHIFVSFLKFLSYL